MNDALSSRAEAAEADVLRLRQELETAKRHTKADAIAFDSMNHAAVDAETELAQLRTRLAALKTTLQRISDGAEECNCDHSDDNCCVTVGEWCPTCLADVALAALDTAHR